jgi:hypothetical protein
MWIFNASEPIQRNSSMDTEILLNPTSKKAIIAKIVVSIIDVVVIICEPVTPIFYLRKDKNQNNILN